MGNRSRVVIFAETDDPPPWSEYFRRGRRDAAKVEEARAIVRDLPHGGRHVRRKVRELLHVIDAQRGSERAKRKLLMSAAERFEQRIREYGPILPPDDAQGVVLVGRATLAARALREHVASLPSRSPGYTPPGWDKFLADVTNHPGGLHDEDDARTIAAACGVRVGRPAS